MASLLYYYTYTYYHYCGDAINSRVKGALSRGRSHLVRNGRGGGRNGPARETSEGGTGRRRKICRTQEGSTDMCDGLLNVFLESIPKDELYPPLSRRRCQPPAGVR